MPRPRSLTPDAIAGSALAVIDRDGLAALSMRTVATELGVSTMALYRYVDDRGQLERFVVDLVLSDVDVRPPARGSWRHKLTVLAERVRDAMNAHPAVTPLTLTHRHSSDGVRRVGEAMLAVLTEAGFDGTRRVIAFRALLAYLVGALQAAYLGPLAGAGTSALALQDQYPLLSETARRARNIPAQQEFRGGLEILLRGLETEH